MLASAVAFGSSAAGFAFAQASTTSRVRTESEMIGRAEAQGASHRRVPPPSQLPGPFKVSNAELTGPGLTTFSNIAARKCVVAREGIVRSGEFVVGWQNQPKRLLIAGQRAKIWWVPLHASKQMPPLEIRGWNISNPSDSLAQNISGVAVTSGLGPGDTPKEKNYFFPTGVTFSRSGRWLVTASTGANWGCFIFPVQ